jgi:hypothetical protein
MHDSLDFVPNYPIRATRRNFLLFGACTFPLQDSNSVHFHAHSTLLIRYPITPLSRARQRPTSFPSLHCQPKPGQVPDLAGLSFTGRLLAIAVACGITRVALIRLRDDLQYRHKPASASRAGGQRVGVLCHPAVKRPSSMPLAPLPAGRHALEVLFRSHLMLRLVSCRCHFSTAS